jgi:hypothetical protein
MEKKTTNQQFAYITLAKIEPSVYQRATNAVQVQNIIKYFDEAKLGTLTVSVRDGKYYIIDGAHRLSALRALNYTHALCEVLNGLTLEDEADYFRRQGQDKRSLKPFDLFKAGLIADDEKCIRIKEILDSNNFNIGFSNKDFYQIGAINALFTIVDDYGFEILDETLFIIAATWAGIAKASCGDSLLGVAEFVRRYGLTDFDERLSNRFSIIWNEYRENTRTAQYSTKARKIFCRILVDFYNKGLGSRSQKRLRWEE